MLGMLFLYICIYMPIMMMCHTDNYLCVAVCGVCVYVMDMCVRYLDSSDTETKKIKCRSQFEIEFQVVPNRSENRRNVRQCRRN